MGLIDRLPTKATQRPKVHFNTTTRLAFGGVDIRKSEKEDPIKGSLEILVLNWTTTEDLTDVDGVVHPAGTELEETVFVYSNDQKSMDRASSTMFYARAALTGSKSAEQDSLLKLAPDLKGRVVQTKLSYSPAKDEPDNREKGFDNFRHTAIRA